MLVGPGECASFLVAEHVGPASGLVGVLPERQSNRPVVVLPGVVVDPKPVGSCLDNFGREHRHVSRQSIGLSLLSRTRDRWRPFNRVF